FLPHPDLLSFPTRRSSDLERTMHDAQRIFYFHVSSWVAMFVAFFVSVFGCFAYLTSAPATPIQSYRCGGRGRPGVLYDWADNGRSEEHTSELQSRGHLVCR